VVGGTRFGTQRMFGPLVAMVLATALVLVSGCIPSVHRYHRPHAATGELVGDACNTVIGPRETMLFRLDGVDVRVSGGGGSAWIRLRVPAGHTVLLASDHATVVRGDQEALPVLNGFGYYDRRAGASRIIAPGDTLHGANDRFLFTTLPRSAGMTIPVPGEGSADYTLQLPGLWVDGRLHELPLISFRRKWAVGIYLLNC
jgi:hypothetical protein